MSGQRAPTVTSEDVERIALREFPSNVSMVLELLQEYGAEDWHNEIHRVHLAVLKLASGDLDRLRSAMEAAKSDYRDVLALAEYPEYFRLSGPGETLSPSERQRIIDADWDRYCEWLAG